MGSSHSTSTGTGAQPEAGNVHSGIPEDPVPYTGPQQEYRVLIVNSKLKATLGGSATSDINEYMGTLVQQYAEYFKLDSFFKVPYQQKIGFMSATRTYQAVFSRNVTYVPSPESWQLQVFASDLSLANMMQGTLFGFGTDTSQNGMAQIYNIINQQQSSGGRLICLECTGQMNRTGFFNANFGVNLFFNIPVHPNPTLYTNTALSVPMQVVRHIGGNVDANLDINGPLSSYLNQGWKLIDIIVPQHETGLDQQQHQNRGGMLNLPTQLSTIWFFDKEQSRYAANDLTPLYQVTVTDVQVPVSVGFGSASAKCDLQPLLLEMGRRGWTVVCVLDIPQLQRTGLTSITTFFKVFFQRPLTTQCVPPSYTQCVGAPPVPCPKGE